MDVVEARKQSANSVLMGLLEMENPSKTLQHYRSYMRLWKDYCSLVHDSDSIVNASKMLDFFRSMVFKRTVKKYIDPNAGFSGVTGMKPNEVKGKSTRLQQRRPGKWTPVDTRAARERQTENDRPFKDRQEEDEEDEDVEDDKEGGVEDSDNDEDVDDDVADQALAEEEGAQISKGLRSLMVNSVEKKNKGK
ncbi:hypothetical protein BGZ97_009696 [Linnemannia gamsii]|uniref:Uncharacterized protein n=1 Tax=Linnemannia gamsii TaxID=64522 RepID=A0A9P6QPZ2_9FUNG|nr:hypothetical protein BGZ97_009696 [Linnemannia gamsii]